VQKKDIPLPADTVTVVAFGEAVLQQKFQGSRFRIVVSICQPGKSHNPTGRRTANNRYPGGLMLSERFAEYTPGE
jgi:hypothetical protein